MKVNTSHFPLEALALNYVSFGILTVINNLWTWVTVLTEGISFWRIRTTVKPEEQHHRINPNTNGSHQVHKVSPADMCVKPRSLSATRMQAKPSVCNFTDVNGATKGSKFTLYYYSEKRESRRELTVVKSSRDDNVDGDECGEWWERLMSVRMGDMGWYCNQDLTMINGHVVRLWDE